jgi:hypothetical protein
MSITKTALLFAVCLTSACGPLRKLTPPRVLPPPPSEALLPCAIPAIGGGDAASVDAALIERGAAIMACEVKRRALVAGWPK